MFCPLNGHVLSMISPFAFLRMLHCALNKLDLSVLPGALNRLSLSMTSPFVLLYGALDRLSLSMTLPFVLLSGALNRLSLFMTSPFVLLSGALNRLSLSLTSIYFAFWCTTMCSNSLQNNSCSYLPNN